MLLGNWVRLVNLVTSRPVVAGLGTGAQGMMICIFMTIHILAGFVRRPFARRVRCTSRRTSCDKLFSVTARSCSSHNLRVAPGCFLFNEGN